MTRFCFCSSESRYGIHLRCLEMYLSFEVILSNIVPFGIPVLLAICRTDKNFFQSTASNSFIYEEIELPCSLVTIGDYAFQNYYSELRKIHFPNYPYRSYSEGNLEKYYSLRNIGQYIFNQNYKILCHNIPPTFTTASSYSFACCSISHIGLNSHITEINSYTFQHCTSLQSIVIPYFVRSIYQGAFYNCQQLQS